MAAKFKHAYSVITANFKLELVIAKVYLSQLNAGQWHLAHEYEDVTVGAFWVCYDQYALYALIAPES
jgi:hypothetical protein